LQHILATQWLRFEGHDHSPDFRIAGRKTFLYHYEVLCSVEGGSVAKWLVCWTRAQKGLGSAATLSGNSLRQTVHTHCASVHQAAKLVAALLRVAMVTAGLMPTTGFMTRHLHADCKVPRPAPEPYLGNRVWAAFTFIYSVHTCSDVTFVCFSLKLVVVTCSEEMLAC